jgi:hypothetical protein
VRGAALALLAGACVSQPSEERCLVLDEATARRIAGAVSGVAPDDGSLQVTDEGDRWRIGRYAETWLEGEMIMSRDAGFTFVIDKCSGAMSGYRAWG